MGVSICKLAGRAFFRTLGKTSAHDTRNVSALPAVGSNVEVAGPAASTQPPLLKSDPLALSAPPTQSPTPSASVSVTDVSSESSASNVREAPKKTTMARHAHITALDSGTSIYLDSRPCQCKHLISAPLLASDRPSQHGEFGDAPAGPAPGILCLKRDGLYN